MSSWASKTGVARILSRCGFGVPFRVPWRPFGTPDGRFLGTLEAVLGHAEAVRAPPLHEKMHMPVCSLLDSFRPPPAGSSSPNVVMGVILGGSIFFDPLGGSGYVFVEIVLRSPTSWGCALIRLVIFSSVCGGPPLPLNTQTLHPNPCGWLLKLWSLFGSLL